MTSRAFNKKGGWGHHNVAAYRSGLEEKLAEQLEGSGLPVVFEQFEVPYVIPASDHKYTPDFILPNGVIIEGKGIFDADDRKKHLLIRQQHPLLDIRFVFTNSKTKLYKGSPTTYAAWCDKHGFLYSDKVIPKEWMVETIRPTTGLVSKKNKNKKET